ncbi:molybdopterin-binding/glycosyltransferase family 2 protein [Flexibacterium corallicola]|uniref:molybdopterin-binding/glycosyltransferase family 2 protein n=1 Tax=Flexibacterium corallicola TaxID=3037259 RepID=UPI00286EDFF5|nr:molybdopterin-binding/glycosyltransferase family 2 protein [Pseudovibrio sp. M1P-2-3]
MLFGEISVSEASGCYLAHSLKCEGQHFSKGHRLTQKDVVQLLNAGITHVQAARLEPEDLHEDEAAFSLAQAAAHRNIRVDAPFSGRSNLYAIESGVLTLNADQINNANSVDASITFATLPPYASVEKGRMLATSKIIPLAANRHHLKEAKRRISNALSIEPFKAKRVGVLSTTLPHLKPSVIEKTLKILGERLSPSLSSITAHVETPHTLHAVEDALSSDSFKECDLVILFGASAVVDGKDVIPQAIRLAGGTISHIGMPVDPGNLLVLGELNAIPVVVAPGCARSPQFNGFDWILNRLLADMIVTPQHIMGMGVGGLLKEIHSRPQPREARPKQKSSPPSVTGILLAAGKSSRMEGHHKLLTRLHGKPLVRHAAEAALQSDLKDLVVVLGHMAQDVKQALNGLPVEFVENKDYAQGLSSSIKSGMRASSPATCDAALILLGDMPQITAEHINSLIKAYHSSPEHLIGVSMANGRRGNPVLWDRQFFADLQTLHGDIGGKALLQQNAEAVYTVELGSAARQDIDNLQHLKDIGGTTGEYSLKPSKNQL